MGNMKKRYIEKQLYSECQVVAALNAAICLGLPRIPRRGERYEALVDLARARIGAAIYIGKVKEHLGIKTHRIPVSLKAISGQLELGHPVGLVVWTVRTGFHSVMVVAIKDRFLKVTNFRDYTTDGWMSWRFLEPMVTPGKSFGSVGGGAKRRWAWSFSRQ